MNEDQDERQGEVEDSEVGSKGWAAEQSRSTTDISGEPVTEVFIHSR